MGNRNLTIPAPPQEPPAKEEDVMLQDLLVWADKARGTDQARIWRQYYEPAKASAPAPPPDYFCANCRKRVYGQHNCVTTADSPEGHSAPIGTYPKASAPAEPPDCEINR